MVNGDLGSDHTCIMYLVYMHKDHRQEGVRGLKATPTVRVWQAHATECAQLVHKFLLSLFFTVLLCQGPRLTLDLFPSN